MKKATTIEQQIARLKERGMAVSDERRASEILLDLGYYRLGFYWFPMERSYPRKDRRNHLFKTGASFDKSVRLYEFDKELRNILSFYLHDIEVNLRTKVIYHVSNKFKDNPFWFADSSIVLQSFICSFARKYNEEIKNNDVRQEIYGFYGFTDDKSFPNYIEIVRQMKNNCAHGHPLFDITLYKSLRAGKFKAVLSGDQGDLWSTLRGVLLVIQYFLFYLPGDKGKQFSKDIRKLMNRHRSEDIMEYVAYLNDVPWLENKI